MPDLFKDQFMPHGMCLMWQPELLLLHALSDGITALAYYTISLALIYLVARRRDLDFGWIFWLFAIFILACGTTHLFNIWVLFYPDYVVDGIVKAVTAFASIGTAIALWYIMPAALAMPGPNAIRLEMAERQAAEAEVRELNERLEARVEQRTAALREALRQKDLYVRETHHRVKNNLNVINSLMMLGGSSTEVNRATLDDIIARIRSIALVHDKLYQSDRLTLNLREYVEALCDQIGGIYAPEMTEPCMVRGDGVSANADEAVPLALIANEVLTNAFKHAKPGGLPQITIDIHTGVDGDTITIRDNGIGLPDDFDRRKSIGVRLIRGLTRQLQAHSSFRTENGTVFTLRMPHSRDTATGYTG